MVQSLVRALRTADRDVNVRAMIVTGAGVGTGAALARRLVRLGKRVSAAAGAAPACTRPQRARATRR